MSGDWLLIKLTDLIFCIVEYHNHYNTQLTINRVIEFLQLWLSHPINIQSVPFEEQILILVGSYSEMVLPPLEFAQETKVNVLLVATWMFRRFIFYNNPKA